AWHGGEGYGRHEDPGIEQFGTQYSGALGLTDHNWRDWGLRVPHVKAEGPQALLKEVRIVPQLGNLILGLLEEFHRCNASGDISGCGSAGKQVWPGTLFEIIDEHLASRHITSNHPKRL